MKKYFNLLLFAVAVSVIPFAVRGQHGLSYNQFGQLRNSFNSSLSVMDPEGGAAVLSRLQWVGVDGAPQAYFANGHVGIKPLGITLGIDVKQARIGVVRDSEVTGYVASKIRLSKDEYLGLSVGGGMLFHRGAYTEIYDDLHDPRFRDDTRYFQGMMSIGTSYFKEDRWYAGISIPRLALSKRGRDLDYEFRQVYNFTGGVLFRVDEGFHIRPSVLVTRLENRATYFDANVLAFFAQQFGAGLGVQNQGDLSGLLQFNINGFGIGYSYQFNVSGASSNQRISNNTHEISLRFRAGGMKML